MQVHVQPAACALQRRDHARLATLNATPLGAARVDVEQHARVHAELRQARPAAGLCHRLQEGLQVFGDDLMEHGVLGVAGPVESHGPHLGARRRPGQV